MHILISAVSSARQPSGICRHAANLVIALANAREVSRVSLLVGRWQLGYFEKAFGLRTSSVALVPIDIDNQPIARNKWYYRDLPHVARKNGADIVHLSFPAPIQRSRFACPVLTSLHDLYPHDAPGNFGRIRVLFNRIFLQQCLSQSDALLCSSDFTLDRLRRHAPKVAAHKGKRIYQSVTLDPRQERAPATLEAGSRPFLLTVAQHRSNKNLDLLLWAFAELRRRKTHLRLVVVGAEGPETGKLYVLVQRLRLQRDVLFLSDLPDDELCWLYRRCELLVVPSSVEGFCFPVVEALRCGSRVLCSDIPVLREIGGPRCSYFDLLPKPSSAALADAIQASLLQPAPGPYLAECFSAKEIGRQYVELYSALLARDGPPVYAPELPAAGSVTYDEYAS
jgi:glycosyltransferase involved in cell wall biosynthesis